MHVCVVISWIEDEILSLVLLPRKSATSHEDTFDFISDRTSKRAHGNANVIGASVHPALDERRYFPVFVYYTPNLFTFGVSKEGLFDKMSDLFDAEHAVGRSDGDRNCKTLVEVLNKSKG